jgi:hypothetical protein
MKVGRYTSVGVVIANVPMQKGWCVESETPSSSVDTIWYCTILYIQQYVLPEEPANA